MPKINVYLPEDLAEAVRDTGVPVSAVCQRALEQAVRRVTAIREVASSDPSPLVSGPHALQFTARAMAIIEAARAEAAADDVTVLDSGYLLRSMASDRDSIAIRVLTALDITPGMLRTELDRRLASAEHTPAASAPPGATLASDVAKALELAASESSGLGTSYLGTEHLLLGLIGEPDGVAGHVLRSLGADLRVTRRTVAAALAGWDARAARTTQLGHAASRQAEEIAAAVHTELAPVLARIERLESLAAR